MEWVCVERSLNEQWSIDSFFIIQLKNGKTPYSHRINFRTISIGILKSLQRSINYLNQKKNNEESKWMEILLCGKINEIFTKRKPFINIIRFLTLLLEIGSLWAIEHESITKIKPIFYAFAQFNVFEFK